MKSENDAREGGGKKGGLESNAFESTKRNRM